MTPRSRDLWPLESKPPSNSPIADIACIPLPSAALKGINAGLPPIRPRPAAGPTWSDAAWTAVAADRLRRQSPLEGGRPPQPDSPDRLPMRRTLKRIASHLPAWWLQELKRLYFGSHIRRHVFRTYEPEFELLGDMVSAGDWALDIGANVGHYTARLSELVGKHGRVIAFEPVPATFELLAANMAQLAHRNITLVNAAASDSAFVSGMEIPKFEEDGLDNFYTAHLSPGPVKLGVLCLPADALMTREPIRLVKVDAEGHELQALRGLRRILQRDHPTLIVEDNSSEVAAFLQQFGYTSEKIQGSSNRIFRAAREAASPPSPRAMHA